MKNQQVLSIETVQITEKHKAEAVSCHSRRCVIALALNEILCRGLYAAVGVATFSIHQYEPELVLFQSDLTVEVADIIDNFDKNEPVKATSFELALPVDLLT